MLAYDDGAMAQCMTNAFRENSDMPDKKIKGTNRQQPAGGRGADLMHPTQSFFDIK